MRGRNQKITPFWKLLGQVWPCITSYRPVCRNCFSTQHCVNSSLIILQKNNHYALTNYWRWSKNRTILHWSSPVSSRIFLIIRNKSVFWRSSWIATSTWTSRLRRCSDDPFGCLLPGSHKVFAGRGCRPLQLPGIVVAPTAWAEHHLPAISVSGDHRSRSGTVFRDFSELHGAYP